MGRHGSQHGQINADVVQLAAAADTAGTAGIASAVQSFNSLLSQLVACS